MGKHIPTKKDENLNFVLLSVIRDKLAEDTVTQTRARSNEPLQRAKAAATRKCDACSIKYPSFDNSTKFVQRYKETRKTIDIKNAILKHGR
ncbi:hypothetical protein KIN20_037476 [Parelaphostrongylus tenuis]|uniref:Uncharacterized protein n=1 Tax=Parelaphostrongylus tenuis TaxID=148309 RepID=A0AAD5RE06_PARTN|nr:hypothetical protein KIN20_037476 [Parelaphostrongylus tenuis]